MSISTAPAEVDCTAAIFLPSALASIPRRVREPACYARNCLPAISRDCFLQPSEISGSMDYRLFGFQHPSHRPNCWIPPFVL